MIAWIKRLFGFGEVEDSYTGEERRDSNIPVLDERGNREDPFLENLINEAWNTGRTTIVRRPE